MQRDFVQQQIDARQQFVGDGEGQLEHVLGLAFVQRVVQQMMAVGRRLMSEDEIVEGLLSRVLK